MQHQWNAAQNETCTLFATECCFFFPGCPHTHRSWRVTEWVWKWCQMVFSNQHTKQDFQMRKCPGEMVLEYEMRCHGTILCGTMCWWIETRLHIHAHWWNVNAIDSNTYLTQCLLSNKITIFRLLDCSMSLVLYSECQQPEYPCL